MTCKDLAKKTDYCASKEIDLLIDMLYAHKIPFEIDNIYDGACISYPAYDHVRILVTENAMSYGRDAGLLEVVDIPADQLMGYQRADRVFSAIQADWQYRTPRIIAKMEV